MKVYNTRKLIIFALSGLLGVNWLMPAARSSSEPLPVPFTVIHTLSETPSVALRKTPKKMLATLVDEIRKALEHNDFSLKIGEDGGLAKKHLQAASVYGISKEEIINYPLPSGETLLRYFLSKINDNTIDKKSLIKQLTWLFNNGAQEKDMKYYNEILQGMVHLTTYCALDILELLLKNGAAAALDAHPDDEPSCLLSSVTMGDGEANEKVARILLKYGAQVNKPSFVELQEWHEHPEVFMNEVPALLCGPDQPEGTFAAFLEKTPVTPLHIAGNEGHEHVVAILLAYGADPSIKCGGLTARDFDQTILSDPEKIEEYVRESHAIKVIKDSVGKPQNLMRQIRAREIGSRRMLFKGATAKTSDSTEVSSSSSSSSPSLQSTSSSSLSSTPMPSSSSTPLTIPTLSSAPSSALVPTLSSSLPASTFEWPSSSSTSSEASTESRGTKRNSGSTDENPGSEKQRRLEEYRRLSKGIFRSRT